MARRCFLVDFDRRFLQRTRQMDMPHWGKNALLGAKYGVWTKLGTSNIHVLREGFLRVSYSVHRSYRLTPSRPYHRVKRKEGASKRQMKDSQIRDISALGLDLGLGKSLTLASANPWTSSDCTSPFFVFLGVFFTAGLKRHGHGKPIAEGVLSG